MPQQYVIFGADEELKKKNKFAFSYADTSSFQTNQISNDN